MKTIYSAILSIALISLLAGAGTFAAFADSEISSGNSLTAGTFDLYLTDGNPNPNAQWTLSQGSPGDTCGGVRDITLHNVGSCAADHAEISFSLDKYEDNDGDLATGFSDGPESDTDQSGVGGMAESFVVDSMSYQFVEDGNTLDDKCIDLVWYSVGSYHYNDNYLNDINGNGYIDLDDLSNTVLDDLPAPKALNGGATGNDYSRLDMCLSFWDTDLNGNQNDFQGDIIDMTVEVTLNQNANQ